MRTKQVGRASFVFRGLALATSSIVLVACGGASSHSVSSPAQSGSPHQSSAPAVDTASFKLAFPDHPDIGNLPVVVTIKKLASEGYNASYTALSGTTSVVAALSSNDVQLMDLTGPGTFLAISKGYPFEVFGQQYIDEDALVTKNSISAVSQLSGKRLALASATTLSASLLKTTTKSAGVQPNIVYLGNSSVREGALLAGKVDGTILELDDVAKVLTGSTADKFHVLVYYPPLFPFLLGNVFSSTQSFMKQHPTIVKALLDAYTQTIQQAYADPTGFVKQYGNLLTGMTPAVENQAMQESVQGKIWGTNGGKITQEDITKSLSFYVNAGIITPARQATLMNTQSKWLYQGG